ncbi:MAG TPA: PAS domain S-box protein, partial [Syntrophaceae bacterium]|nr:PAS domain S-box protein [Syntrophaceae bacterium]
MDEIRYNKHQKLLKVAIVGGGRRCREMLEMVALGELKIEVIGVADINQDAPGIKSARERGIYTTSDYKDLYKLTGLDLIVELTGDPKVYDHINQTKPYDVQVVGYIGARLLWDIISDERKIKGDYITLAESSLTGIYIYQDQRLRFVNEIFAEMFGYTKEELVGMEVWNLIHPQDREILRGRGEKRLKGEDVPSHYECRGITKDGRTIWLDVRATVIEYKGRPAILVNTQDITQRKHMEEALKESEKKYRRIFETSKDVLYLTSREGKFIDINQAGVDL